MGPEYFFLLSALLFSIGVVGVVSRRNLFVVYISIEMMLGAVNLLLVTFSKVLGEGGGAVMALLMIAVIAAEAALFLAIIVHLFRQKRSVDSDQFDHLQRSS